MLGDHMGRGAALSSHADVDRVFANVDVLSEAQNSRGKSHALIPGAVRVVSRVTRLGNISHSKHTLIWIERLCFCICS